VEFDQGFNWKRVDCSNRSTVFAIDCVTTERVINLKLKSCKALPWDEFVD